LDVPVIENCVRLHIIVTLSVGMSWHQWRSCCSKWWKSPSRLRSIYEVSLWPTNYKEPIGIRLMKDLPGSYMPGNTRRSPCKEGVYQIWCLLLESIVQKLKSQKAILNLQNCWK